MKKESWVGIGGILTAVAASLCCIGPVIAVGLGLGSATLFTIFEPYRPILLGLTGLLVAYGYFLLYIKTPSCKPGETCEIEPKLKNQRKSFWGIVIFIAVLLSFPFWIGLL